MANIDDIIQRIIVEVVDKATGPLKQISQAGQQISGSFQQLGQQLGQVFTPATASVQKLGQAAQAAGPQFKTFADATRDIAALGATAPEALAAAAAAAQKFGASIQQLQAVTGVINALQARSVATHTSFQQLAQSYSQATASLTPLASVTAAAAAAQTGLGRAFAAIGSVITGAISAVRNFGSALTASHGSMRAVEAALSTMGVPFTHLIGLVARLGFSFGVLVAGTAAVVAGMSAATAASISAADNAQKLGNLAEQTGQSFERLGQEARVFRELGVSLDAFTSTFSNLASKLKAMAPDLAEAWALAGDKIKTSLLDVQSAMLQIQQTKLDASNLQIQQQQISLQGQQLQLQAATFAGQRQGLALQGQQLANNLGQIRLQLQYSSQLNSIERQRASLTVADAAANLRILLLKRQLRDGEISEEEFAQRMAEEEDKALNRAIAKARVDLEAAKVAQEMLPKQQALQQQAMEIQARQLELQLKMLPIQEQQLRLAQEQNKLDQDKNKNEGAQNALDIQKNIIQSQRDLIALNKAAFEEQKAAANDIRAVYAEIIQAQKEGREAKFPDLTSQKTIAEAYATALSNAKDNAGGLATALGNLLRTVPADQKDLFAKAFGLPPEVIQAYKTLSDHMTTIAAESAKVKPLFTEEDRTNLKEVGELWEKFKGQAVNAKDALGAFNATTAISELNSLNTVVKGTTASLEQLAKAMNLIGGGKDPMKMAELMKTDISGGLGKDISFGLSDLVAKLGPTLKSLFKGLFEGIFGGPAAASELIPSDKLKQAVVEPIKQAIDDASKLDASGIVKAFEGVADKIRDVFKDIDLTQAFDRLAEQARDAARAIVDEFKDVGSRIGDSLRDIRVGDAFDRLVEAARSAANSIIESFQGVGQRIAESFQGVGQAISNQFAGITEQVANIAQNIVETMGQLAQSITQAFSGVGEAIASSLVQPLEGVQQAVANLANGIVQAVSNAMDQLARVVEQAMNTIVQQVQRAIQAIQQAQQAAQQATGGGSGGSGGLATGGLFRGRAGRDANLVWLSDYEYVMRPEAVQKYGVALMHMINSLQFPLNGFRMGGIVLPSLSAAAVPAFAGGGLNRSGTQRTLNITIGDQTFRGLSAPEHVAQQLERAAVSRQSSATGVKPRWQR